ncbi:MAG: hypothetical protein VX676_04815, partial [Pseudomonadota bacterium]|nr:hypothetical protein [Pseudomonadota bacterium]
PVCAHSPSGTVARPRTSLKRSNISLAHAFKKVEALIIGSYMLETEITLLRTPLGGGCRIGTHLTAIGPVTGNLSFNFVAAGFANAY